MKRTLESTVLSIFMKNIFNGTFKVLNKIISNETKFLSKKSNKTPDQQLTHKKTFKNRQIVRKILVTIFSFHIKYL